MSGGRLARGLWSQPPPPSPPSPPPPAYSEYAFYGKFDRCRGASLYYDEVFFPEDMAFDKAAKECRERCLTDIRCNAIEISNRVCELHSGKGLDLRAKNYPEPWPKDNRVQTTSCWMKQPPDCNRACDRTHRPNIAGLFALPTAVLVMAFLLAVTVKRCRRQRDAPTDSTDSPAAESWELPSKRMATRIVPKPPDPEDGASADADASAAAQATGAQSNDASPLECAFCLCDVQPGEVVMMLPCHHEFHASCFKAWELVRINTRQGPPTCPLCKADLVGSDKQHTCVRGTVVIEVAEPASQVETSTRAGSQSTASSSDAT
jgi:hypothetical protein